MTPFVDYDRAADRYDTGRKLEEDGLEAWRRAITARLAPAGLTVLDVGAGTGIFARAWIAWGASEVVAVEPSAAMRERAAAHPSPGVTVVDGSTDALPAEGSSVDVVWMSAVLHHVRGRDRCADEIRRVLRPGGHLLVRGYFPDRSRVPWLDWLPGAERARGRFPRAGEARSLFEAHGLRFLDATEVPDPRAYSRGAAAAWIERMRDADSLLTALTPAEVDAGIAALRAEPAELLPPLALTLLTFT
jgi:ubiquinone/menaquinone biosynthesis C-methylase UbiE